MNITPKHLWKPLLTVFRDLGRDGSVVRRRTMISELRQSHGIDILSSPDQNADYYVNKAVYLLREEGLIETVRRGEYKITPKGLVQGLPEDTDFGGGEDDGTEGVYLKTLWSEDPYILGLVARSAPCYGNYSPTDSKCTHKCAVAGACHTRTLAILAKCVDGCPQDTPVLKPTVTEKVLRKMPVQKDVKCGITGKVVKAGGSIFYNSELGFVCEEAATDYASKNPGWGVQ